MNPQRPISWEPSPAPISRTTPASPSKGEGIADNAAFQAVLERLENAARDLSRRSESLEDTKALSGAVQDAAQSLGDALALRDSVLEAYRSAQQAASVKEDDAA
ncbi:MAG: hypothetical protein MK291_06935 [Planctomycetes bacterium]|nr:hypothetical protein [Planctomycetota bacterium]